MTGVNGPYGGMSALAEVIDLELRALGSAERAAKEQAYLKSDLVHYGVGVPATRAVVKAALKSATSASASAGASDAGGSSVSDAVGAPPAASRRRGGPSQSLDHDEIVELVRALWAAPELGAGPVFERRAAAVMVLIAAVGRLGAGDAPLIESLLRESRTWALVDPLACDAVGAIVERDPAFAEVLERWSVDGDFWIRRSVLLAHVVALRRGVGDFERFARFADAMLEEKEFFIRKAIGWVLRDTSRTRPDLVYDWILPRAHRASGVTLREAVKHLSEEQRSAVLAAR